MDLNTKISFDPNKMGWKSIVAFVLFFVFVVLWLIYSDNRKQIPSNVVSNAAPKNEIQVENNADSKSYNDGYSDGYVAGVQNAQNGVDLGASDKVRIAKEYSDMYNGDAQEYASGFHLGYNTGYRSKK